MGGMYRRTTTTPRPRYFSGRMASPPRNTGTCSSTTCTVDRGTARAWPGTRPCKNLCVTPAFLAKLTDTDAAVCSLLRYRAYDLYGYCPDGIPTPPCPTGYDGLAWRAPLDAVRDVERRFRLAMATKPRDRTVLAARELGWRFSDFAPDPGFVVPDKAF